MMIPRNTGYDREKKKVCWKLIMLPHCLVNNWQVTFGTSMANQAPDRHSWTVTKTTPENTHVIKCPGKNTLICKVVTNNEEPIFTRESATKNSFRIHSVNIFVQIVQELQNDPNKSESKSNAG